MTKKLTLFLSLFLCLAGSIVVTKAQKNELVIPGVLEGPIYNIRMHDSVTTTFFDGQNVPTIGMNEMSYLAPTMILNAGDSIKINVTNELKDTSTMHWHGLHVSPTNDGGPETVIAPDSTWNINFKVLDAAGTYWYHPHLHHKTNKHVALGAAGLLIVRDDEETTLDLPQTYGVDEFPLIIQDKRFGSVNGDTVIEYQSVDNENNITRYGLGNTMMVNGVIDPYQNVPAQMVRYHTLNGSQDRSYLISLCNDSDNQCNANGQSQIPFYIVGTDGGLFKNTIEVTEYLLGPGERIQMILDFSYYENDTMKLISTPAYLPYGVSGNGVDGPTEPGDLGDVTKPLPILDFIVGAPTIDAKYTIPYYLSDFTKWAENDVDKERTKTFYSQGGGVFDINHTLFDMNVINDTVKLDDIEIWTLIDSSGASHPFHIHDIQFYILEMLDSNGVSVMKPYLQGKKDVVMVPANGSVRFITKFETFFNEPGDKTAYMYHCHILPHEDNGMMGQFIVVKDPLVLSFEDEDVNPITVFPNPTNGLVAISGLDELTNPKIIIYNAVGEVVKDLSFVKGGDAKNIDLSNVTSGVYILNVISEGKSFSRKIIIRD
ncbi:MAG: multicopper oxidase domain-containing protein [Candidatus Margulisbacteria bacterium]|nr:multicopper oxidase domain-containing protein [Candidatus Margulisiibacteriota bacterium]